MSTAAEGGTGALFGGGGGGGGGAASWLIDFKDLSCSSIIGEGAFGKVGSGAIPQQQHWGGGLWQGG